VRHLGRFGPAPAVCTKCGSSAGHWSWSTRAHHAGAEAASLAACEATNRLHGAGVQVASPPRPAVPIRPGASVPGDPGVPGTLIFC